MLDRITIIFAHKSERRGGDVAVRSDVTNPILWHLHVPYSLRSPASTPLSELHVSKTPRCLPAKVWGPARYRRPVWAPRGVMDRPQLAVIRQSVSQKLDFHSCHSNTRGLQTFHQSHELALCARSSDRRSGRGTECFRSNGPMPKAPGGNFEEVMTIDGGEAAIRMVIASVLAEHGAIGGRAFDALAAMRQAEAIVRALELAGYEIRRKA